MLAVGESFEQVFDAFRALPLEFCEREMIEVVQIGDVAHKASVDQLRNDLLTEPADVHRSATSEVLNAPLHLFRTFCVGAADHYLALVFLSLRSARRTFCGNRYRLLLAIALRGVDRDH